MLRAFEMPARYWLIVTRLAAAAACASVSTVLPVRARASCILPSTSLLSVSGALPSGSADAAASRSLRLVARVCEACSARHDAGLP